MGSMQIVSVAPEVIVLPARTYRGRVEIPACNREKVFQSATIDDSIDYTINFVEYDYMKAIKVPVQIPAKLTCEDYTTTEKLTHRGCFFIPAGEQPTAEQIAKAQATRRSWLQALVQAGDEEFLRAGKIDQIPGFCKRAVEELGVEREWAFIAPPAMQDCPACGEKIKLGVAICKSCGAIVDRAKAIEFGLLSQSGGSPVIAGKHEGPTTRASKGGPKDPNKEIGGI